MPSIVGVSMKTNDIQLISTSFVICRINERTNEVSTSEKFPRTKFFHISKCQIKMCRKLHALSKSVLNSVFRSKNRKTLLSEREREIEKEKKIAENFHFSTSKAHFRKDYVYQFVHYCFDNTKRIEAEPLHLSFNGFISLIDKSMN